MPIQLHLRQIVVADKQAAQATLERLIKTEQSKLLEVFEQEAKNSIDTEGAKKGGDLGWLGMDRIVEPFAGQLAMLKNGELSQSIVRGPNGWHIILLQERSPERAATIEEARAKLEAAIKYEKLKSIMAEKKEQLMKKYKVEMVK
jgi:peptidyl-prolyl cis-trans isomerase C